MESICKEYNISQKNGMFCLEDIAKNIIGSKTKESIRRFCNRREEKTKIGNKWFVNEEGFRKIIKNGRAKAAKIIQEKLLFIDNDIDQNDTATKIDIKNNIFIFMGRAIRIVRDINNDPWFCAYDICDILEYKEHKKARKNNTSKLDVKNIEDIQGGFQIPLQCPNEKKVYLNEFAVYSLILRSKMDKAVEFRNWITREVLPSIRKNGTYIDTSRHNKTYMFDIEGYKDRDCVYIVKISDEDNVYKFGRSTDMYNRMNKHSKSYDIFKIVKIYDFTNHSHAKKVETMIKVFAERNDVRVKKRYHKLKNNTKSEMELFSPTKEYSLYDMFDDIDNYIEELQNTRLNDNHEKTNIVDNDYQNMPHKTINNNTLELVNSLSKIPDMSPEKMAQYFNEIIKFNDKTTNSNKYFAHKTEIQDTKSVINYDNLSDDFISVSETIPDKYESSKIKSKKVSVAKSTSRTRKCKDCNKFVTKQSIRCNQCNSKLQYKKAVEKSNRPSVEILKREVKETSYVAVGKKYGVTDNCIRKWIEKGDKFNNIKIKKVKKV